MWPLALDFINASIAEHYEGTERSRPRSRLMAPAELAEPPHRARTRTSRRRP